MTRFDEVVRLRELEKRATPGKWNGGEDCENYQDGSGEGASGDFEITDNRGCTVCTFIEYAEYENSIENAELLINLRNAAPWLLGVVGCFQPGDAERIARIRRDDLLEGCCAQCDADVDMMHRLQKAAAIMEGQE